MKRAALAIVSTVTGLVLLLSFKTHALGTAAAAPPAAVASNSASGAGAANSSAGSATANRTSNNRTTGTASKSVTGNVVQTGYGPIQVRITVKNGKVTGADTPQYPTATAYDQQLNSYAIPMLNAEAVRAGSAHISQVSGATYTSAGYVASLQSALNKAGI